MKRKKPQKITLEEAVSLFGETDTLAVPLATGQPMGLMQALGARGDFKRLEIFSGLMSFPYPLLSQPGVHLTSGYYGPIERYLNESGAAVDYLPSDFTGFEIYALRKKFRVTAATLSAPDSDGFLTFGTHSGAAYRPFREACRDEDRIAIAEVNATMPVVYGVPELGDNKIALNEIDYYYEVDQSQIELPEILPGDVEKKIAENVVGLIGRGDTLQFGIGGIPDQVATLLAEGSLGDFGIHSELVSDGFLKLQEAGKISNRHKGVFKDASVFTFALGAGSLYRFLDERRGVNGRRALCLPVSVVNDPHVIAQNQNFVSVNSGLMVDFSGQVCSEAIGLRQYSGVGGQLSFVQGAYASPGGRSLLCIKSTATVEGKLISNIVPTLPAGSLISTPRHYTQYIVTEYGVADLYGVSDEKRGELLVAIAHPQFRDELREEFSRIQKTYYKNS